MIPESVAVIGAGQMGLGIAQVLASVAARNVFLYDLSPQILEKSKAKISASLTKLEEKGKIAAGEAQATMKRLQFTDKLESLKGCQFFIEAIIEKESVKRELFGALDKLADPQALFASNTSSIPIALLGSATKRADKMIGMHFMNPVPLMTLVEIIRGPMTSDATYEQTKALAEKMGKQTVCSKDFPGFIVNRILMPMINEAFFTLHEGVASADDIDKAMKLGTNQPMGPLALADFIGLDTCLFIMEIMLKDHGDPKFRPCPLLRQYVQAGLLGKKTGRGVFRYEQ